MKAATPPAAPLRYTWRLRDWWAFLHEGGYALATEAAWNAAAARFDIDPVPAPAQGLRVWVQTLVQPDGDVITGLGVHRDPTLADASPADFSAAERDGFTAAWEAHAVKLAAWAAAVRGLRERLLANLGAGALALACIGHAWGWLAERGPQLYLHAALWIAATVLPLTLPPLMLALLRRWLRRRLRVPG